MRTGTGPQQHKSTNSLAFCSLLHQTMNQACVLWEIKTHRFDTYPDFIQEREIEKEVAQLTNELAAARACGYDFVVGVSTQAHRLALIARIPTLHVVVTGCTR